MIGIETLASSVDTWECDENDHMNVRFYWTKFAEAERHFRLHAALEAVGEGTWRSRHVRFHRELRGGAAVVVRSMLVDDGPLALTVLHEMYEVGHGFLAATAVDVWVLTPDAARAAIERARAGDADAVIAALPTQARPRGIEATAFAASAPSPGSFATVRAQIAPIDMDGDGRLQAARIIGWGSNAAPHVWARIGFDQPRLDAAGLGRVAMEMRLTRAPVSPRVGDLVRLASTFGGASRTTVSLRHHLVDARDGRVAATLEAVALTMDLERRRAVPLPPDVVERARAADAAVTVSPH